MERNIRRGEGDIWRKIETYAIRNTIKDTSPKIETGEKKTTGAKKKQTTANFIWAEQGKGSERRNGEY